MALAFRHCDPRFPFLWQTAAQPPARWHGAGEGPANYFCDTPSGAWAEFLRHEGITDAADLPGVRRGLWAVELPAIAAGAVARPALPAAVLLGDESSYPACQAAARAARATGLAWLTAPGAALLAGQASGWTAAPALAREAAAREGQVWVHFGACGFVGWPAVEAGRPPVSVLPLVRPL
ncbi:MAG: RES domain-containing protein [Rubrivivax sp.]